MLAFPALASANPTNITTGRAYDIAIKTSLLSSTISAGPDTGLISTNRTTKTSRSAASAHTAIVNAYVLNAGVSTSAQTESAIAKSSVALANLAVSGLPVIGVSLISAESTTSCRQHRLSKAAAVTGSITVNGKRYSIASPPNTMIPLLGGSIILNEQRAITNGLLVNAIHIKTILGTEVVISSARSAVANCA